MSRAGYFFLVAGIAFTESRDTGLADIPVRIVSASKQFIIESNDPELSSTIAISAERLKAALLEKLQLADGWRSPVLISVFPRKEVESGNPITMTPYASGGELWFVLRAQTPPPLNRGMFFRGITQVLCAELINRPLRSVQTGETLTVAPLWLSEGLWQSVADQAIQLSVREVNLVLLQRATAAGRGWSWAQLTATTQFPSDPVAAQLFGAQSQVLVESLLALPDGLQKMQKFVAALASGGHWQNAFSAAYTRDFPDETSREKWWALRLQVRAHQRTVQTLSAWETERQIEVILPTSVSLTDPNTGAKTERALPISELGGSWALPGLEEQIDHKITSLGALYVMSHATFRPAIIAYSEALVRLRQRQFRQFTRMILHAEKLHQQATQQTQAVADYLNDLEAQQSPGLALSLRGFFMPISEPTITSPAGSLQGFLDKIQQSTSSTP